MVIWRWPMMADRNASPAAVSRPNCREYELFWATRRAGRRGALRRGAVCCVLRRCRRRVTVDDEISPLDCGWYLPEPDGPRRRSRLAV